MAEPDPLLELSDAVAAGATIDWERYRETALESGEESTVEQLRLIATIAAVHRTPETVRPPTLLDGRQPGTFIRRQWGPLVIVETIAEGSFGRVYRANDPRLQRDVALKVLGRHGDQAPDDVLVGEAQLLARVRHPNVVAVYGADVVEGEVGLWMELIEGQTLASWVAAHGPLGAEEAAVIGATLCRAVAALHQKELLHRDIKAQNVMREPGGRIVLMDFGAVRELLEPVSRQPAVGTPVYLAPEILSGGTATVQSDIYSLGVLLFYLTTLRYPVVATTLDELRARHAHSQQLQLRDLRADLPASFVDVVSRALDADPAERFESAGQLEQALLRTVTRGDAPIGSGAQPTSSARSWLSRPSSLVAIAATISIALATGWSWFPRPVVDANTPSIAVLPLRNVSGDPSKQYLADSLTQVLITHLTKVKGLRVLSHSAVTARAELSAGVLDVSKALGVRYVLEGAVTVEGALIRTTLQLFEGSTGETIWAEEYSRDPSGLLGQQAEIARIVASRLKVDLGPAVAARLQPPRSVSAEAQDLYLRGQTANEGALVSFVRSVEYLEQAVEMDPQFAEAWAALAQARVRMTNQVPAPDRSAQYERARSEALRALELDPMLHSAHAALGVVRFYHDWDWQGAADAFKRAIEIAPGDWSIYDRYSIVLAGQADLETAIEVARQAVALDPMGWRASLNLATVLYYARRYDDAMRETDRVLEISPGLSIAHFQRCRLLAVENQFEAALAECAVSAAKGNRLLADLERARLYALAGRRDESLALVAELRARPDGASISLDNFALIEAALGDTDAAFVSLELAVAMKTNNLLWIRVDPRFDPLRKDLRFNALVDAVMRGAR